jgi:uncharacterized damage-inducible protein DinB
MLDMLRRLVAHLRWADQQTSEALRDAAERPAAALEVYCHLIGSEHVWLERLRQESQPLEVWPELSLEECARYASANSAAFDALLGELEEKDLLEPVAYRNSKGQLFSSTVADIILHVALHGSYHRGQIALLLRQAGSEPAPTDYIGFVRGVPAATRRK